ncbi:MAG: XkdQ/YqbQ family protein [Methanobacteriaceae archaeon]
MKFYTSKNGTSWKNILVENDWKIKKDAYKLDYCTITTDSQLGVGDHILAKDGNKKIFAGQIVEPTIHKRMPNNYEAVDYRFHLGSGITKEFTKKRASDIVKELKKHAPNLKWVIGNTSKIYSSLEFKDTSIFKILCILAHEEFLNKNLIEFRMSAEKIIFRPYPTKVRGLIVNEHLESDYSIKTNANDIVTGYTVTDEKGNFIKTVSSPYWTSKFGDITVLGSNQGTKQLSYTKKSLKQLIKKMITVYHEEKSSTDYDLSYDIFVRLRKYNVSCKIVLYANKYSVIYKNINKWVNFPYNKLHKKYRPNRNAIKKGKVVMEYG